MGESACRFRRGRNRPGVTLGVSDFPVFQGGKGEELVLDDRVAQSTAQHVLTLRIEAVSGAVSQSTEPWIPSQVEASAVPLIGAGLGGHGNGAAGAMAGL